MSTSSSLVQRYPWLPYVAPFAAYMGFIVLDGAITQGAELGLLPHHWTTTGHLWLYPVKIAVVVALLWHYRHHYPELSLPAHPLRDGLLSVAVGILVFGLWIQMDWPFATMGDGAEGYNPYQDTGGGMAALLIGIRLAGAALVVPLFEELFWRGFIMRYLVHPDFKNVPIGTFTWVSFVATSVLFGVEHHLWLAGIMAGAAYGGLLLFCRNLTGPILAHGVTNLLLGIWVLNTEKWGFW